MAAKKYIVVAEDNAFLIKIYAINLEREGYDVTIGENGQKAIDAIDARQPDLLMLDLIMPQIDGFAVLEHIQQKGYTFPVIILSNVSDEIDQQKCLELGAKDYFVKSDMDLNTLLEKVKKYL